MVLMPKVNHKENVLSYSAPIGSKQKTEKIDNLGGNARTKSKVQPTAKPKKLTMQEQMMADALAAAGGDPSAAGT